VESIEMLAQAEQAALDAIAVQHPAQAAFVKANPANAEVSFSCLLVSVSSTYQRVRSTALIPVLTHCVFARATPLCACNVYAFTCACALCVYA
jgi:hypothetical protein